MPKPTIDQLTERRDHAIDGAIETFKPYIQEELMNHEPHLWPKWMKAVSTNQNAWMDGLERAQRNPGAKR